MLINFHFFFFSFSVIIIIIDDKIKQISINYYSVFTHKFLYYFLFFDSNKLGKNKKKKKN